MIHPMTTIRAAALVAPFVATPFAGAQFTQETSTRFPTISEYTNQVSIGDIDNDGDLDIIWANGGGFGSPSTPLKLRIYINDGLGFFTDDTDARNGGITGRFRGVEMGDIDRDGDLDVLAVQDFGARPYLFVNDGTGHFTSEGTARGLAVVLTSSRGQFGDIDNDGDLDVFMTTGASSGSRFSCGQYRLYANDGDGFFTDITGTNFPAGNVCNNMDAIFGDIDNDFDIDIRTASTGSANSRLYVNNGSGVFSVSNNIPADSSCYSYDFGDMDGDGDLDLFGANAGSGNTDLLLRNNGAGVYSNASGNLSSNPNVDDNDSVFLDWDNDGDLDLMVGRLGGTQERTYTNNGLGIFTLVTNVMPNQGDSTLDIKAGDLDGDGDYDIVTAQGESGAFQNRIYINNGPADTTPPMIVDTEDAPPVTEEGYVIRVLILDSMSSDRNFFDKGIFLNYSLDGGATEQVEMVHSGGQVYRGVLPCSLDGSVDYFVTAFDANNNMGTGATKSFTAVPNGGIPCDDDPVPCAGDTNGDNEIDIDDIVNVVLDFDTDGSANGGDVDDGSGNGTPDGIVSIDDIVYVVINFGPCP
jgi:hypothetical protein